MRNIILDTETTGLDPKEGHRIIEIGCLEMIDRRLTGNNLHFYINPERNIERGAAEVHGITEASLQDKPVFASIAAELLSFLNGAELIIHNAPFDISFLNYEFKLLGKTFKPITHYCTVIDTLILARRKHPGQQNSLDALCRRYHVDNSNRELHGALLDAELLAQVYLLMTGGQSQLFELENHREVVNQASATIRRLPNNDLLPIIVATTEELELHHKFLQMLRKSGKCSWQES